MTTRDTDPWRSDFQKPQKATERLLKAFEDHDRQHARLQPYLQFPVLTTQGPTNHPVNQPYFYAPENKRIEADARAERALAAGRQWRAAQQGHPTHQVSAGHLASRPAPAHPRIAALQNRPYLATQAPQLRVEAPPSQPATGLMPPPYPVNDTRATAPSQSSRLAQPHRELRAKGPLLQQSRGLMAPPSSIHSSRVASLDASPRFAPRHRKLRAKGPLLQQSTGLMPFSSSTGHPHAVNPQAEPSVPQAQPQLSDGAHSPQLRQHQLPDREFPERLPFSYASAHIPNVQAHAVLTRHLVLTQRSNSRATSMKPPEHPGVTHLLPPDHLEGDDRLLARMEARKQRGVRSLAVPQKRNATGAGKTELVVSEFSRSQVAEALFRPSGLREEARVVEDDEEIDVDSDEIEVDAGFDGEGNDEDPDYEDETDVGCETDVDMEDSNEESGDETENEAEQQAPSKRRRLDQGDL